MAKTITTGADERNNPERTIDLGPLRYQVDKYRNDDVSFVVYKMSYAGKYIYIKGKTLAGSLIIIVDTLNSFDPAASRFKGHLYTHLYTHLLNNPGGRFRIEVVASAADDKDFYLLLKEEQKLLDMARYDANCLNNQTEAYIPQYSEKTASYGWIPKMAVMNFQKYLKSKERKDLLKQYKK